MPLNTMSLILRAVDDLPDSPLTAHLIMCYAADKTRAQLKINPTCSATLSEAADLTMNLEQRLCNTQGTTQTFS
jgi:hypothetical protein